MGRLAVLKIGKGDFNQGFEVSLQICKDNALPFPEIEGKLPANPEIESLYTGWQATFRSLRTPYQNNRQSQRGTDNNDDWLIDDNLATNRSTSEDVDACRHFFRSLETGMKEWLQWSEDKGWQKIRERLGKELVNKSDETRIILRAKDPILWKLPWHVWDLLDSNPDVEIALSLPGFEEPGILLEPVIQKNQVRILAVLGDSKGINIQADREAIRRLDADPVFLPQPGAQEFIRHLRLQNGWDIFFFAGHSKKEGDTGRIYINENQSLEIEDFKNALKAAIRHGLKLAIFNSCDGLGLAQKLADVHIPVAIVMRESIPDRVAQSFLKEFLTEYASGQPLYTSVRRARERLEEFQELPGATWLPIVCQNPVHVPPTWHDFYAPVPPPPNRKQPPPTPPRLPTWRRLHIVLFTSLLVTSLIMGARSLRLLQSWELSAFDHLMRERPPELIDPRILVVEVTEQDTSKYKYPLEDATVVKLIKKLEQYQPRVIGLDMHRYQPREPGRKDLITLFQQNKNIFIVCSFSSYDRNHDPPSEFSENQIKNQVGFSDLDYELDYEQPNINDKTVRRQHLSYEPKNFPSFSLCNTPYSFSFHLAYKFLAQEGKQLTWDRNSNNNWYYKEVIFKRLSKRMGGYQNLDGQSNQILLNYRSSRRSEPIANKVTLTRVLEEKLDESSVKNRVILVGTTTSSAKDDFDTAYGEMPGVWIHAHMVSQILSAVIDNRPLLWVLPQWDNFQWGDTLWVWIWSLIGGLLALRFHSFFYLIVFSGINLGVLYETCLSLLNEGGWMPLIPSVLSVLTTVFLVIYITSGNRTSNNHL